MDHVSPIRQVRLFFNQSWVVPVDVVALVQGTTYVLQTVFPRALALPQWLGASWFAELVLVRGLGLQWVSRVSQTVLVGNWTVEKVVVLATAAELRLVRA